ncbi:MAG: MG2 domain-containing protein [Alphaproteobacteria bacterium]
MALQTFEGASGMDVVTRSLADAKPVPGVTLTLIAANNDELARVRTDGQGRVRFAKALLKGEGALRPRYVMAYGARGDFTALDLERPTLDLADKGIDGRATPGDVDAFLYTDRGIYRPGEYVRLAGLIRDPAGRAISNRQSVLVVYRPNGTEAKRQRLSEARDAGAVIQSIAIDKSAPRGQWRAELLVDGQDGSAGSVSWAVEDFVPQRLKVEVTADETPMKPGETRGIDVTSSTAHPVRRLPSRARRVCRSIRIRSRKRPATRSARKPKTSKNASCNCRRRRRMAMAKRNYSSRSRTCRRRPCRCARKSWLRWQSPVGAQSVKVSKCRCGRTTSTLA